jgi:hypothetical protein
MKTKWIIYGLMLILLLISCSAFGQLLHPTEKLSFDKESIKQELIALILQNNIPGYNERYGFYSDEEIKIIEFGKPMAFYALPDNLIAENKRSNKLDINFIGEWLVPVIVKDQLRCFIFLKNTAGKVLINGYGSKLIADELIDSGLYDYSSENQGFILVADIGCKFLVKNESNEPLFAPLGDSKHILNHTGRGFLKADLFIDMIYYKYSEKNEKN